MEKKRSGERWREGRKKVGEREAQGRRESTGGGREEIDDGGGVQLWMREVG